MVKLNAPLMSLDASGTVADSITFAKWKGRNYARVRVVPANPKTAKQSGVRAVIKFLGQQWNGLSAQNKASWQTIASQDNVSPFNAYVGKNAYNWRNALYPSQAYPAARSSTAPSAPTVTATGGTRQCTLQITKGATAPTWGYSIHRSTQTGITASWTNCIAVVPVDASGNATYIDTPLAAGTYYYTAVPFNADGKAGTQATQTSANVT
jgi:hypothetical protein